MPRELSETEEILLEKLDRIEKLILEFELSLADGDWRTLVHGLFRDMHNLKSSLSMAGYDAMGKLAHAAESLLDRYRSGKGEPQPAVISLILEATDISRSALLTGAKTAGETGERYRPLMEELEKAKAPQGESRIRELTFPLEPSELCRLHTVLAGGNHPYILEKFISGSLTAGTVDGLPIFDAIREAGEPVAWRHKKDSSGGAVLSILFGSVKPSAELSYILFDPFYPVEAGTGQAAPVTRPARIPRILIVDDDPVAIMILQHFLAPYGRVDTATSGPEAVEKFRATLNNDRYDSAFLDIMMPGMDGLSVLRAFRELEKEAGLLIGEGCRIVMASALSDFPSISTSFHDLCDAYLVKPFDKDAVLGTVAKFGFKAVRY